MRGRFKLGQPRLSLNNSEFSKDRLQKLISAFVPFDLEAILVEGEIIAEICLFVIWFSIMQS